MNKTKLILNEAFPDQSSWLFAGAFHRNGGVSPYPYDSLNTAKSVGDSEKNVIENRKIILDFANLNGAQWIVPNLNHTSVVKVIDKEKQKISLDFCDAVITNINKRIILMSTGDCSGVFFADFNKKIIALAHAGWKGIDQNICSKVIDQMILLGTENVSDINIHIGPSIGPCCYVLKEATQINDPNWKKYIKILKNNMISIDLWSKLKSQLIEKGIDASKINNHITCTSCNTDKFFSYSKERPITGRFANVICIR